MSYSASDHEAEVQPEARLPDGSLDDLPDYEEYERLDAELLAGRRRSYDWHVSPSEDRVFSSEYQRYHSSIESAASLDDEVERDAANELYGYGGPSKMAAERPASEAGSVGSESISVGPDDEEADAKPSNHPTANEASTDKTNIEDLPDYSSDYEYCAMTEEPLEREQTREEQQNDAFHHESHINTAAWGSWSSGSNNLTNPRPEFPDYAIHEYEYFPRSPSVAYTPSSPSGLRPPWGQESPENPESPNIAPPQREEKDASLRETLQKLLYNATVFIDDSFVDRAFFDIALFENVTIKKNTIKEIVTAKEMAGESIVEDATVAPERVDAAIENIVIENAVIEEAIIKGSTVVYSGCVFKDVTVTRAVVGCTAFERATFKEISTGTAITTGFRSDQTDSAYESPL
ncbi:hypothetical protein GGR52DRAFT_589573 [Hypoxylon sp. FL1284]|nr:hypothetical protein GGR52DRAFT_589573 [Hypoxylon sp. FL1284]